MPLSQTNFRPSLASRRGLGLMEVIIIIFAVGVVLSLSLPSIQYMREAARLRSCESHLSDIGKALQLHVDAHSVFPTGGGDRPERVLEKGSPAGYRKQQWGWAYQLLPFMGEESIWSARDYETRRLTLSEYFCPSRRPPTLFEYNGLLDYAALGGGGDETDAIEFLNYRGDPPQQHNGVFVPLVRDLGPKHQPFVGYAHIPDGLEATIAVSEKAMSRKCLTGGCPGDNRGYWSNWCWDSVRFVRTPTHHVAVGELPPNDSHLAPMRDQDLPRERNFDFLGSAHASGFQALFCSGVVRHLGYDIDTEVLKSHANRMDSSASL
jgi:hypothetical protein